MQRGKCMQPMDLRSEIAALRHTLYMNWGGSGPSPRRALEAANETMLSLNDRYGPMSMPALEESFRILRRCRERLATLLGAETEEIALMESTSDGINRIAWGIPWQEGDEIVITDSEHISGIAPWEYLAERLGVRVVRAPVAESEADIEPIVDALTERTRLLFVSHVSYKSGAVLPLAELTEIAHQRGIFVGVDGAQSVGQLPIDLAELGVDFYALPGQKWLLGPDGTGALFVRREAQQRLLPSVIGWASLANEGVPLNFHPDARRYEVAGRFVPAFAAFDAAVECIAEIGVKAIRDRILQLVDRFTGRLSALPGVEWFGPRAGGEPTGLVACTLANHDPAKVVPRLWKEHRIVCRWIDQPRLLRFSIHAFNTEDEVDEVVDVLERLLEGAED